MKFQTLLFIAFVSLPSSILADINVGLDGNNLGRTFEGLGGVSAGGGNSRLLIDYPEPYRSEILDLLFKPKFGASLQHLKVEIGSESNTTDGSEATHARTRAEMAAPDFTRGFEWWIMRRAKDKNPDLLLDCLEWGIPKWIGGSGASNSYAAFFSQDNADYIASFIKGAKSVWGLDIDYTGVRNEDTYDRNWIVDVYRPTLDRNGLTKVKIVAADGGDDNFGDKMAKDPAFAKAVDVLGVHYLNQHGLPTTSPLTPGTLDLGKPIWASEDFSEPGLWENSLKLARQIANYYVVSRITKLEVWPLLGTFYPNLAWSDVGMIRAQSPWSGHYEIMPQVWAMAHYTQFADPGWKYIEPGCGSLGNSGYFVSFRKPGTGDYSVVIGSSTQASTMNVTLSGGLSTGNVHVWKSNQSDQFVPLPDIVPVNGAYSLSLDPDAIYSLTTTTGQRKGAPANAAPARKNFPLPYRETFESYNTHQQINDTGICPKYFPKFSSDMIGTFENVARSDGGGNALRQMTEEPAWPWNSQVQVDPYTMLGDDHWTDYQVGTDALIEHQGSVSLYGRISAVDYYRWPKAYFLRVDATGNWSLFKDTLVSLASGKVAFSPDTWHTLRLKFVGNHISAYIDNISVAQVNDNQFFSGNIGVGSGWNHAQFDNIWIASIDSTLTAPVVSASATSQISGYEAAKSIDGDGNSFWHSQWQPPAPLPQAITLDLGSEYSINALRYDPRHDGSPNGTITEYTISTSSDGTTFQQVATGVWADDLTTKSATWTAGNARYVRLTARAGHAGYASASEVTILTNLPVTPPNSAFERIEAESYDRRSGMCVNTCAEGGQDLGCIGTGDYALYKNIDFGSGAKSFNARIGAPFGTGKISVILDDLKATPVGVLTNTVNTGGWETFTTGTTGISTISGVHDVYLQFETGINLNWFTFSKDQSGVHKKPIATKFGSSLRGDHLRIALPWNTPTNIRLASVTGQSVFAATISGTSADLAIGDIPRGVYLLEARSENGSRIQRVIKN